MKLELYDGQISTVRMALMAWSLRCHRAAVAMDKLALAMPADAERCNRNAEASRSMKADADDLIANFS